MRFPVVPLAMLAVLVACGGDVGPPSVTPEQFCERLASIVCEASRRCCTDEEQSEDSRCEQFRNADCREWTYYLSLEGLTEYRETVPDGLREQLRFRGAAAAAYLAELERVAQRCEPIPGPGWIDTLFEPALAAGDACLLSGACADGLACVGDRSGGTCAPRVGLGEVCGGPSGDSCEMGLECVRDSANEAARCERPKLGDNGERCADAEDCASGFCAYSDDVETASMCTACTDRADCAIGFTCEAGACVPAAGQLEPRALDERCRGDEECESRDCHNGVCVVADPNHTYCTNPLDWEFPPVNT